MLLKKNLKELLNLLTCVHRIMSFFGRQLSKKKTNSERGESKEWGNKNYRYIGVKKAETWKMNDEIEEIIMGTKKKARKRWRAVGKFR